MSDVVSIVAVVTLGLVAVTALILRSLGDITELVAAWRGTPATETAEPAI
jgi:hypothetical protein